MSKLRSIKSLSLLWMGSFIGSGSTFIIYMILARQLGDETFGIFSSALATITIFSILSGFGVAQSWLKHFGKDGWDALKWLPSSFKLVIYSIVIVMILVYTWTYLGPHDIITKEVLYVMSIFIMSQTIIELVSSKLQLEERYSFLALWQLSPNILRLIIFIITIYIFKFSINIIHVAYIYSFVSIIFIITGIYQLYFMSKNNFKLKGHGKKEIKKHTEKTIKDTFAHSWAFGLAGFFAFIYLQSDIIMLKYIVGNKEAAYYNVSFIMISAILIFPSILYSKFLMPKYHRWANHDKEKFYNAYKRGNTIMLYAGILFMLGVLLTASYFIPMLFGNQYINSINILKILSIALPVYFISYSIGATLVTKEYMKLKVKIMGYTALLNIILNIILIPIYQGYGAAYATILSNFMLLIFYYKVAETKIFKDKRNNNVETN